MHQRIFLITLVHNVFMQIFRGSSCQNLCAKAFDVTTRETRCVNFCENLKLFVCFGVQSIFEPKLLASHQFLH
jgi:hypothetical protein